MMRSVRSFVFSLQIVLLTLSLPVIFISGIYFFLEPHHEDTGMGVISVF